MVGGRREQLALPSFFSPPLLKALLGGGSPCDREGGRETQQGEDMGIYIYV